MKVQPITELKDIKAIKRLLQNEPRNRLLFIMGINSGLRTQDLLCLRVEQVQGLKVGDRILVKEKKTAKDNVLIINKEIDSALKEYLDSVVTEPGHFLFKSRKGTNSPLTTYAVTMLVCKWTSEVNLKGNYGAHTMRKTWCYMQRVVHGVSWTLLSARLNHSTPSVTRRYLGIQDEEVEKILMNNF